MDGDRVGLGVSPRRRKDARFLIGKGAYLDDLMFPDVAHAIFVRSPHAHVGIRSVDATQARGAPGVLAVLTAEDVAADGLNDLPPTVEANVQTGKRFHFTSMPLLARDEVRYVGQLLALVVAETKAAALDAAELVHVEYEPRPAVATPAAAAATPDLLCMDWRLGDADAAFAGAAHVVSLRLHNGRIVTNPMEPRGVVAVYDPASEQYIAHVSSQSLHGNRDAIARVLNVPPGRLRFVASMSAVSVPRTFPVPSRRSSLGRQSGAAGR